MLHSTQLHTKNLALAMKNMDNLFRVYWNVDNYRSPTQMCKKESFIFSVLHKENVRLV